MSAEQHKPFKVAAADEREATLVCPRRPCGQSFTIDRVAFKTSRPDLATRPCPYCFRVSLVPRTTEG